MEIFAPLVGVSFRGKFAKELVKTFTPGDAPFLSLETEPENAYDSMAVKVNYTGPLADGGLVEDEHIGYLARQNNSQIFNDLTAAETAGEELPVTIEIISFENTIKPVLMISW